jgi:Flp pilus assembly protein TadG
MKSTKMWVFASLARFGRARKGAIALIFALALIPLILLIGFAVDFRTLQTSRAELQNGLDSAMLAAARTYQTNGTLSETARQAAATTAANAMFNANMSQASARMHNLGLTLVFASTKDGVTGTASAVAPLAFGPLAGVSQATLGANSQVVWGQKNLWVSLVLDNTGSMCQSDSNPNAGSPCPSPASDSKIAYLKTASSQLIDILKGASSSDGDVQVSLVPFSRAVHPNFGSGSSLLNWTDWEAAPPSSMPGSSVGPGSNCPYGANTSPFGYTCQGTSTNGSANKPGTVPDSGLICPSKDNGKYNSGRLNRYYNGCYNSVPSSTTTTKTCITPKNGSESCTTTSASGTYTGTTAATCTTKNGTQTCISKTGAPYSHTWVINSHSTWDGCTMDRTKSNDVQNTLPVDSDSRFPAENSTSCLDSVVAPLTYDWQSLKDAVTAMQANGSTNQTIGLDWGWLSMTPGGPTGAPTMPVNTTRFIILLSDGLNTQNRWDGNGSTQSTQVDARMALACSNAKTDGITIYTVFVDLGDGNSDVLKQCASDSSKYYALSSGSQISTAFQDIGQKIAVTHIAH